MEQKKQSSNWIDKTLNDVRYWEDINSAELDELQDLFNRLSCASTKTPSTVEKVVNTKQNKEKKKMELKPNNKVNETVTNKQNKQNKEKKEMEQKPNKNIKMEDGTMKVVAPYVVNEGAVTKGMTQDEREHICALIRKQLLLEKSVLVNAKGTFTLDPMVLSKNQQCTRCRNKEKLIRPLYGLTHDQFYKLSFDAKAKMYQDYIQKNIKPSGTIYLVDWRNKRIQELEYAPDDVKIAYCGTSLKGRYVTMFSNVVDYFGFLKEPEDDARRIYIKEGLDENGDIRSLYLTDMHRYEDTDPHLLDKIDYLKPLIDLPDWIVPSQLVAPDRTACNVSDLYTHKYERSNYAGPQGCQIGGIGYDEAPIGPATYITSMSRKSLHRFYGEYSTYTKAEYKQIVEYIDAVYKYITESPIQLGNMLNEDEALIKCPKCGALIKYTEDALTHNRYCRCSRCGYDSELQEDYETHWVMDDYTYDPDYFGTEPDMDDYEYLQDLCCDEDGFSSPSALEDIACEDE